MTFSSNCCVAKRLSRNSSRVRSEWVAAVTVSNVSNRHQTRVFHFGLTWLKKLLENWVKQRSRPDPAAEAETGDRACSSISSAPLSPDLQREIRAERPFSLAEAIGREGGDFLKGENLVPRPLRAIAEINLFIDQHLVDRPGALHLVLQTWVKSDSRVSQHFDAPLLALEKILAAILADSYLFYEFARQVNAQWGSLYDEIPRFQPPGQPPHPQTAYPHAQVRQHLAELQTQLQALSGN